jgi:hypothetical protein
MFCQCIHHAIAPFCCLDLIADVSTDLPVQVNQCGIDGLIGVLTGGGDQVDDFGKSGCSVFTTVFLLMNAPLAAAS